MQALNPIPFLHCSQVLLTAPLAKFSGLSVRNRNGLLLVRPLLS